MRNPLKNAIRSLFYNPRHILYALLTRIPWLIPNDEKYLSALYWINFGVKPDLINPVKFSEKIQWLKLHNRNSLYTTLVDKYKVKEYVSERLGEQYIIPVIAVWDSPQDIEWEVLPKQFVIKTNHDGGGNGIVICKDKASCSINKVLKEINRSFRRDSYMHGREWPYKNVPKNVFAEQLIMDSKGELRDYKFFCFNGRVRCFKIDYNRHKNHQANYYDLNCNLLMYGETIYPFNPNVEIHIPDNIREMIILAEKLSEGFPFVRVDLYNVDGRIYFGEFTFFPAGGMSHWDGDIDVDALWGSWLELP